VNENKFNKKVNPCFIEITLKDSNNLKEVGWSIFCVILLKPSFSPNPELFSRTDVPVWADER
jgi:hypothetical protein